MKYFPTIGLEIHVELNTKTKMFCACRNDSDEIKANLNVCPICLAHPGVLPTSNQEAIKKVIKTGLAFNCQIVQESFFERKNYFYPDLPKGYQISQYRAPLCQHGFLMISPDKKIRIERVHLEEDTAKLLHSKSKDYSLVDFNRAGVPLMELVTEPDMRSSQEVADFVRLLQTTLRYLGVSGANMEKGEMRAEVNISLNDKLDKLGVKVEIKNLNSVRAVEKAIEYEIKRQSEVLDRGEVIVQETRGWKDDKEITFSQRSKESAHDYRYFPEPDLPALRFSQDFIDKIKVEIPELPEQRKERLQKEYNITEKEALLYVQQKDLGDYLEKVVSELLEWASAFSPETANDQKQFKKLVKLASNYLSCDLQAMLKGGVFEEGKFPITPENFAEFLAMIYTGQISSKMAKDLLKIMFETGGDPSQIVEDRGLKQITDEKAVEKAVEKVILANPKAKADYQAGKGASLQFLAGQVMAQTKGKAKPELVQKILKEKLNK